MRELTYIGREQWLDIRRSGIGGSDAGAICGLNKWKSPVEVWAEKTGKVKHEDRDSEAMRIGRDFEDYVAKRFQEATGKKVRRKNRTILDKEYDFLLANVDRFIVGENAILECKTASPYTKDKWADGSYPDSYALQCHHYMMVTGAEKVYLACLIMGVDFVIREIDRDDELISSLRQIEVDFWQKYVVPGIMPPPDGSDSAGTMIAEMYPESFSEAQISLPDDALDRYDELTALIDDLSKEREAVKQSIQLQMEDAETAYCRDRKITWKLQKGRTTIDSKKLKAEAPEIYEQFKKEGKPQRVFRIQKG